MCETSGMVTSPLFVSANELANKNQGAVDMNMIYLESNPWGRQGRPWSRHQHQRGGLPALAMDCADLGRCCSCRSASGQLRTLSCDPAPGRCSCTGSLATCRLSCRRGDSWSADWHTSSCQPSSGHPTRPQLCSSGTAWNCIFNKRSGYPYFRGAILDSSILLKHSTTFHQSFQQGFSTQVGNNKA